MVQYLSGEDGEQATYWKWGLSESLYTEQRDTAYPALSSRLKTCKQEVGEGNQGKPIGPREKILVFVGSHPETLIKVY